MARQRMIHPDFFIDEDIAMLSPWARLLLISLLTQADREGRLADREKRIHLRAFPWDRDVDLPGHLAELAEQGFIVRYVVDGSKYISIRNFLKFQKPHPKEAASTIPAPPERAGELSGSAGKRPNEPANFAGVGIRNTESDTESESEPCSVSQPLSSEAAVDVRESPEPEMPPIEAYGAEIVDAWHEARGSAFPQPSNRDFQQLCDWHGSGIPLRVVVRGITDCIETMRKRGDKPAGKPLAYYNSAVRHAYGQWHKALA